MIAQNIFDTYRRQRAVLKNYMHIFELLLRLRQTCDHNFLVLMCLSGALDDRRKGSYGMPHSLRDEMLRGIREGDRTVTNGVVARLFSVSGVCTICLEELYQPYVTPCGNSFELL